MRASLRFTCYVVAGTRHRHQTLFSKIKVADQTQPHTISGIHHPGHQQK